MENRTIQQIAEAYALDHCRSCGDRRYQGPCECHQLEAAYLAGASQVNREGEKLAAWNLAITIANNECMQTGDDWNNDDAIEKAHAAGYLARRIRAYIDNPVPELGAIPSRPSFNADQFLDKLRAAIPDSDNPYDRQAFDYMVEKAAELLNQKEG